MATDRERRLPSGSMGNTLDFFRLCAVSRLVLPGTIRALGVGSRRVEKTSTEKEFNPKGSTNDYHELP